MSEASGLTLAGFRDLFGGAGLAWVLLKQACLSSAREYLRCTGPDYSGEVKDHFYGNRRGTCVGRRVYLPMCITQDSLFLLISYTGLVFFGDSLGVELVHLLSPEE